MVKVKHFVSAIAYLAVLYPVWVWYGSASSALNSNIVFEIFPVLGLVAFVIMWLHVIGGALRSWLEKHLNFGRFATNSSIIVLILLILHPLLLFIGLGFKNLGSIFTYGQPIFIWLAIVAWFVLVGYDVTKRFKNRDFFVRYWDTVKFISTLGFFLVFFHSLGLGRDLQTGPLRTVWIFYGATAALAAIYTYGVKGFLR